MKRRIVREAFTKASSDILKSSFVNLARRGVPQDKYGLADAVSAQPAYKAMKYDDRSDIDDFIDSLPEGPLQTMAFNTMVDKMLGGTVAQAAGVAKKLTSVGEVNDLVSKLSSTNPEFKRTNITAGTVGGAYSQTSIASLSHGMGPVARTVTAGDPKSISGAVTKVVNQTYRPQMDPKNRHASRAFSDVRVDTGARRFFTVVPHFVDETSTVYDVYADELVPESVFEKRNVVYGALIRQGVLPPPIEMKEMRRTRVQSESLIRSFILESLKGNL